MLGGWRGSAYRYKHLTNGARAKSVLVKVPDVIGNVTHM